MEIDIGMPKEQRVAIVDGLVRLLADTSTRYLKTHNFHWNVTGPHINSLHAMFMVQTTERIRSPGAMERVRQLVEGHEAVCRAVRSAYAAAEAGGDEATLDLLTQRLQVHEKTAWMLRSLLES